MRFLLFIMIELGLLPFQVVAILVYVVRIRRTTNPARISGTANEPLNSRLIMHQAGTRKDEPTARLAPRLPAYDPAIAWLFGSFGLAARLSGYMISWAQFPVPRPSTLNAMVGHRTQFFDRLLTEAIDPTTQTPAKQIVILGAGWDTRAWGLLADTELRIFEVDMPPTQQAKRAALQSAGLSLARVNFVETDLAEKSWLDALKEQGFDPMLPTFVLWEGVTMYLGVAAVDATLREVGQLARGSRIAFDFLSRELLDAKAPFEKLGQTLKWVMRFYANEPLRYGISTTPPACEHVEHIVVSQGLELAEYEPFGPEDKAFGGLALAVHR
jgi:methyltransferase (TIGR00027 family)